MSVIVDGMKMPKFCTDLRGNDCPLWDTVQYGCRQNNCYSCDPDLYGLRRPNWCPLRPAPEWVSVEERLPEIKEGHVSDDVLVLFDDGGMGFSALEENIFGQTWFECERLDPNGDSHFTVTHWMPLPSPPTEKEADQCRK